MVCGSEHRQGLNRPPTTPWRRPVHLRRGVWGQATGPPPAAQPCSSTDHDAAVLTTASSDASARGAHQGSCATAAATCMAVQVHQRHLGIQCRICRCTWVMATHPGSHPPVTPRNSLLGSWLLLHRGSSYASQVHGRKDSSITQAQLPQFGPQRQLFLRQTVPSIMQR